MTSLKTAFLWFSEKFCARAKAGRFDKTLRNQRYKYSIVRNAPDCLGCGQAPPICMSSFSCCTIYSGEGRVSRVPRSGRTVFFCDTHMSPEFLPGRLTSRSTPSTQSKPCPVDVLLPTNCHWQSHLTTPRADCSCQLKPKVQSHVFAALGPRRAHRGLPCNGVNMASVGAQFLIFQQTLICKEPFSSSSLGNLMEVF